MALNMLLQCVQHMLQNGALHSCCIFQGQVAATDPNAATNRDAGEMHHDVHHAIAAMTGSPRRVEGGDRG
jgi:hypothetical protein